MLTLVTYASRHGSTRGIAERIAERLRAHGLDADVRPAAEVRDASRYEAFVVGAAAYMFHWLKDATTFVKRNRALLAERPTWLFSSGPGSYYWPIWPMLGTAIPVIGLLAARVGPAPALPRRVDPPSDLR